MREFGRRIEMKHKHPVSGIEIEGRRLSVGEQTRDGDMYDSTDGSWRVLPSPHGTVSQKTEATIVRPS